MGCLFPKIADSARHRRPGAEAGVSLARARSQRLASRPPAPTLRSSDDASAAELRSRFVSPNDSQKSSFLHASQCQQRGMVFTCQVSIRYSPLRKWILALGNFRKFPWHGISEMEISVNFSVPPIRSTAPGRSGDAARGLRRCRGSHGPDAGVPSPDAARAYARPIDLGRSEAGRVRAGAPRARRARSAPRSRPPPGTRGPRPSTVDRRPRLGRGAVAPPTDPTDNRGVRRPAPGGA